MSEAYQALARAQELVTLQRYEQAAQTLAPALGEYPIAFCLLAQCRLGLDDPAGAEQAARQALEAGERGEWPYRLLAVSHLRRNRWRPALEAAEAAVREEPEDPQALHILTLVRLRGRKPREAMPTAQQNLRANPGAALAHYGLGLVHASIGNAGDAEFCYRNALRIEPEDTDTAIALARLLRSQGRDDEATKLYLGAAAVDPTDSRIRRDLSRLGLPALGVVAVGLLKYGSIVGVNAVIHLASFAVTVVLWLAVMGSLTVGTVAMRIHGGRSLPPHVQAGLRADYRNSALGWGRATGIGCVLLGVVGISIGSVWAGIALLLAGAGLILARRFLWSGPLPRRRPLRTHLIRLPSVRELVRRGD